MRAFYTKLCFQAYAPVAPRASYGRVDREALWSVLKIYGVGGQLKLLKVVQAFCREPNAYVRVGVEFSESFAVEVGVKQGCVCHHGCLTSLWMGA